MNGYTYEQEIKPKIRVRRKEKSCCCNEIKDKKGNECFVAYPCNKGELIRDSIRNSIRKFVRIDWESIRATGKERECVGERVGEVVSSSNNKSCESSWTKERRLSLLQRKVRTKTRKKRKNKMQQKIRSDHLEIINNE
jgi:hypothetical protein